MLPTTAAYPSVILDCGHLVADNEGFDHLNVATDHHFKGLYVAFKPFVVASCL